MADKVKQVVVIGASAGGLEPIQDLVDALSPDFSETAFIIAQHLSPNYKSLLSELIAKKAHSEVITVKEGIKLHPNIIYVVPPDKHLVITNGTMQYVQHDDIQPKPSITLLLQSVAKEYKEGAVGIILSGTGQDGADGITFVREHHGITIAQSLESCKYTGMPQAAIKTGHVDYVLEPKVIGRDLNKILNRKNVFYNYKSKEEKVKTTNNTGLDKILELLEKKTGVDFTNYKKSTINRRLEKRMQFKKVADIEEYVKYVVADPSELEELFKDILIGVTRFYRDAEVFEALKPVLEKIVSERNDKDESSPIRIWVPGCASGEEPYSIAIHLAEVIEEKGDSSISFQIFATDIDTKALNHARIGYYKKEVLEDVPKKIREKYFKKYKEGYVVNNKLKRNILFSKHDVTANPPFLKLDLISCRNLLIYFDTALQRQVIPVFHYALSNDAHLLLGKSESASNFKNLFIQLDAKNKLYIKKPAERRYYSFPQLKPVKRTESTVGSKNNKKQYMTISEMVKETIYNTFEHPYIVVDENLDMVEVNRDTSKYIQFKEGTVTTNILKVISSEFQLELRAMAGKVMKNNESVKGKVKRFKYRSDEAPEYIRLSMKPLLFSRPILPYYLIVFEKIEFDEEQIGSDLNVNVAEYEENPEFLQLEQELESTKEHMNTLIEELETSNEELQSTNEELQSSNEELQASNEELETSNEELQATNEELQIAYAEIRKASEKIEDQKVELIQSGNRLKALFNSTVQGHVLIENNYNISMFNKTAQVCYKKLFGLELKTGKPYVDYIPTDKFKEFHERFHKAKKGKANSGVTYFKDTGDYYSYHYLPINKSKNVDSNSVLISFHEVTKEKQVEKQLKEAYEASEEQKTLLNNLFVNAPNFIAVLSPENFQFKYINPNFENLFSDQEILNKSIIDVLPNEESEKLIELLEKVRGSRESYHSKEVQMYFTNKGKKEEKYFNITCSPLIQKEGIESIVLYATDVTMEVKIKEIIKSSREMVKLENEKFHQLFDYAPLFIARLSGPEHILEYANPFFKNFFCDRRVIDKKIIEAIPELKEQGFYENLENAYKSGETYVGKEVPAKLRKKDTDHLEDAYFNVVFHPRKESNGNVEGITIIGYEVTEMVDSKKVIEEKANYLFMLSELMPQKVFTATPQGQNNYNNGRMTDFSGLTNEELINDGWKEVIHPEDLVKTEKMWVKALNDQHEFQIKHRLKSANGQYLWHLTRTVPVFDYKNELSKWIGTSTDMHEQISLEKQKDEFLNLASHELKTPLTTIIAYTELLKEMPVVGEDKTAKGFLEKSLKNQMRLHELMTDLLDVTRIQSGKLELKFSEIDYRTLIQQSVENMSYIFTNHKLIFESDISDVVPVDETRIEQVITNLVSNAVKYSSGSDKVLVKVKKEGDMLVTSVKDYGIGIPKNKQNYIFKRFYRVDDTDTGASGLGIGLYISAQLVRAHNGKIWLESEVGKGSTFYFSIPLIKK